MPWPKGRRFSDDHKNRISGALKGKPKPRRDGTINESQEGQQGQQAPQTQQAPQLTEG